MLPLVGKGCILWQCEEARKPWALLKQAEVLWSVRANAGQKETTGRICIFSPLQSKCKHYVLGTWSKHLHVLAHLMSVILRFRFSFYSRFTDEKTEAQVCPRSSANKRQDQYSTQEVWLQILCSDPLSCTASERRGGRWRRFCKASSLHILRRALFWSLEQ